MAICDEAAFMSPDFIEKVVLPLLEVKKALLVFISTPIPGNYYDDIVNMKNEDGTSVINVVDKGYICRKCQEEGSTLLTEQCEHSTTEKAFWKSQTKGTKIVSKLMRDPMTYKAEMMCVFFCFFISISALHKKKKNFFSLLLVFVYTQKKNRGIPGVKRADGYFDLANLKKFMSMKLDTFNNYEPKTILVMVDPSNWTHNPGSTSEYAVLSCMYKNGSQSVSKRKEKKKQLFFFFFFLGVFFYYKRIVVFICFFFFRFFLFF